MIMQNSMLTSSKSEDSRVKMKTRTGGAEKRLRGKYYAMAESQEATNDPVVDTNLVDTWSGGNSVSNHYKEQYTSGMSSYHLVAHLGKYNYPRHAINLTAEISPLMPRREFSPLIELLKWVSDIFAHNNHQYSYTSTHAFTQKKKFGWIQIVNRRWPKKWDEHFDCSIRAM